MRRSEDKYRLVFRRAAVPFRKQMPFVRPIGLSGGRLVAGDVDNPPMIHGLMTTRLHETPGTSCAPQCPSNPRRL